MRAVLVFSNELIFCIYIIFIFYINILFSQQYRLLKYLHFCSFVGFVKHSTTWLHFGMEWPFLSQSILILHIFSHLISFLKNILEY